MAQITADIKLINKLVTRVSLCPSYNGHARTHEDWDAIHVVLHSSFSALRRESFGGNHSVFRGKGRLVITNRILRRELQNWLRTRGRGIRMLQNPVGGSNKFYRDTTKILRPSPPPQRLRWQHLKTNSKFSRSTKLKVTPSNTLLCAFKYVN